MSSASTVDEPWLDIVEPATAPVAPEPWMLVAVISVLVVAVCITLLYRRQPQRRAQRDLRQLRRLTGPVANPRQVADRIVDLMRRALACNRLEALQPDRDCGHNWHEYLSNINRYRFGSTAPSAEQLRAAIDEGLDWIGHLRGSRPCGKP